MRAALHHFVDKERIRAAIDAAERTTHASIHVSIAPYFWGDVRRTAERAFAAQCRVGTRERVGVLFFVVPSRREFAVVGDTGTHERLGQSTWDAVVQIVRGHFAQNEATAGLEAGIELLGRHLAQHFPPHAPRSSS